MPHDLLTKFHIDIQSEFSKFLNPNEVIRGKVYKLTLSAKNIGASDFPGAKVEELQVQYRPHSQTYAYSSPDSEVYCPEIAPGNEVEFYSDDCIAMDEGAAWIKLKMKANDGVEVKCFQSSTSPMEPLNSWQNWFYVVEDKTIRIVALLNEVLRQLK